MCSIPTRGVNLDIVGSADAVENRCQARRARTGESGPIPRGKTDCFVPTFERNMIKMDQPEETGPFFHGRPFCSSLVCFNPSDLCSVFLHLSLGLFYTFIHETRTPAELSNSGGKSRDSNREFTFLSILHLSRPFSRPSSVWFPFSRPPSYILSSVLVRHSTTSGA